MKKVIDFIRLKLKPKIIFIVPLLILLIFILSIADRHYYIGGDLIFPLNPINNILKSIYLWDPENRGVSFFKYMYLVWQSIFYLPSLFHIPPDVGIKLFIAFLYIIGFTFTYLSYRVFFRKTKYDSRILATFAGIIFILNPAAVLVLNGFYPLYCIPACVFFFVQYLDKKRFWDILFFSFFLNLGYFSDLPQARNLVILVIVLFFILLAYKQLREITWKVFLIRLFSAAALSLLLNLFVLLPFFYDSFKTGGIANGLAQNITVYDGNADLHFAALPFITRFFNFSLVDQTRIGRFLASRIFTVWTFFLLSITLISIFLPKEKKQRNVTYIFLFAFVLFIFIAKGANPPFGEIYKWALIHIPFFKVLRSASTVIIGATIFYALLVTITMYFIKKKSRIFFFIILLLHIIIFHPVYMGYKLFNPPGIMSSYKGIKIPGEYYQMGKMLDNISEDSKILSLPIDETYSYKDWGYMGSSILNWITKKPFIHAQVAGRPGFGDNLVLQRMNTKESCFWTAVNNIGYILNEKDSRIPAYSLSQFNFNGKPIFENSYFRLDKVKPECFLPHAYAASNSYIFEGANNSIPDIFRFIQNKNDVAIHLDSNGSKLKSGNSRNMVIEAYPNEISDLDKYIVKDISSYPPLEEWSYSFVLPMPGSYEMVTDNQDSINKETYEGTKGQNTINIPIQKSENIVDTESLINSQQKSFSQVLNRWEKDTVYLLSLRYTVETTSDLTISLDEIQRTYNGRLAPYDLNNTVLSQEISLPGPGVHEYQVLIRSNIAAQSAKIALNQLAGDITIESLNIKKLTPPKIFFVRTPNETKSIPYTVIHKIDPTKYSVDMKKVRDPYFLILSETFNTGWKAYIKTCKTSCNIFSDWFLKPIPEERHIVTNGFSNGWSILPADSKGKTEYTIIIEYWPQRLFYIGVIISILTVVIGFFVWLFKRIQRIYERNH